MRTPSRSAVVDLASTYYLYRTGDPEPFYVGCTINPKRRLGRHRRRFGPDTEMHVFFTGPEADALRRERQHIDMLWAYLGPTANRSVGGEKSFEQRRAEGRLGGRPRGWHGKVRTHELRKTDPQFAAHMREVNQANGRKATEPGGWLHRKAPCPECGLMASPGNLAQHRRAKHPAVA